MQKHFRGELGYKKYYTAGFLAYGFMLALSVLFYKERMVVPDAAYYLFHIVKDNTFTIQHYRFIAIATEVFPLLARRLELPLQHIALIYSMGFVIYYALCYAVCGMLRQYRIGIALLLFHLLFITHTFYWMLSELILGIDLMMVLLAFIVSTALERAKWLKYILMLAGIITIAFAHPLLLFPFGFALIFLLLQKEGGLKWRQAALIAIMFIIVVVVKALFFKEEYDSNAMQGIGNFGKLFSDYFSIHSQTAFLKNCLGKYIWIPLSLLAIGVVYIRRRSWSKLALVLVAVIGYVFLVNVSYPDASTREFYIENLYTPLGIFLGLPLVYDVLPALRARRLATAVLAVFAIAACVRIYGAHIIYKERIEWMRAFAVKHENGKYIIDARHAPMDLVWMTWCSPYEFWLLSTIETDKTVSILITDNIKSVLWGKNTPNAFLPTWGQYYYKDLPAKYFRFTDSTSVYQVVR